MQSHGETNADACAFNDLALVKVDPADVGKVNPSIPFWGGPTGVDSDGTAQPATPSSATATPSCAAASPSSAPSRARASATTATAGATPSTPSRPASPATRARPSSTPTGKALGVLSTVAIAPLAGSNGVGDVAKELAYANSTGGFGVTLAQGTEAFTGPLLPI